MVWNRDITHKLKIIIPFKKIKKTQNYVEILKALRQNIRLLEIKLRNKPWLSTRSCTWFMAISDMYTDCGEGLWVPGRQNLDMSEQFGRPTAFWAAS